jgi:peptide/nickel transport system substrate-binding protein
MKWSRGIMLVLLGILLAIAPVVGGCGDEETATSTTAGSETATTGEETATTVEGSTPSATDGPSGDLVVVVDSLGNEVWAPDVGSTTDKTLMSPVYECLVGVNTEGEFIPRLAESWEVSADGLTWDFYLQQGIQWQEDYGELTAEDVKYTFDLIGSPGSLRDVPLRVGADEPVKSIDVVDAYHIRLVLNTPNPTLLTYLADHQCDIACKAYFEEVGHDAAMKKPVGTGPWKFVDYQPAGYIKFEAVPDHWRQTPAFASLTIKAIPELSARLAMLQTGEADISLIPPEKMAEVESAGLHIKLVPGSSGFSVALGGSHLASREKYDPTCPWAYNSDEPWDSDQNQRALKVRTALALAIDKDAMIATILNGLGSPTPLRDWPLGTDWTRPEWEPYPFDPERAKELLAEAGYPDGFDKKITVYAISGGGSSLHPSMSQAVATDWETNLGLEVEIVPIEWSVLRAKTSDRDTAWSAYVTGWTTFLEPWLDVTFCGDSRGAFVEGFEHLELDSLIDQVKASIDLEERKEAARELGDFLIDHIVEIGIATTPSVVACSSKVGEWSIRWLPDLPVMDFEYIAHP